MDKKNKIIHNVDYGVLFQRDLQLKSVVKYMVLVFAVIISTTILIIDIKPEIFKNIKKLLWILITFLSLNFMSINIIKKTQNIFDYKLLSLLFIFIAIGFEMYLFIYVKQIQVTGWNDYFKLIYLILLPFSLIFFFWELIISFSERKTQPLYSKKKFYNSISNLFLSILVGLIYFIVTKYTKLGENEFINIQNSLQIFYFVISSIALFLFIAFKVFALFAFNGKVVNEIKDERIYNILALSFLTPVVIWFSYYHEWTKLLKSDIYFMIVPIITILITYFFAFFKKDELGSSKVFQVVVSTALLLIWGNKFAFEIYWKQYLDLNWTIIISLASTNAIAFTTVWKRNSSTKKDAIAFMSFIIVCIFIAITFWFLRILKINIKIIAIKLNIDEFINSLLMGPVIAMLCKSLLSWFLTMRLINNFHSKEVIMNTNFDIKNKIQNINKNPKLKESKISTRRVE